MNRRGAFCCWLGVALLGLLLTPNPAVAQVPALDDLFNPNVLHDVHLLINSRDLKLLNEHFDLDTAYPADFIWRGTRVRNVAVRARGLGSRVPQKLPIRVDFNYYVAGRKFQGLTSLALDNLWQDPAFSRDVVTMELFSRMGISAPRRSFCRLFINNVFHGVFTMNEPIDASFLSRAFGDTTGNLFEYKHLFNFHGEYLGDALGPYEPMFQPQTRETDAESALWGPIRDMFREINSPFDASWRSRVEQYVDVPQLVRYLAIDTFTSQADGFAGSFGLANFFYYRRAGSTLHQLLPVDTDLAFFEGADSPIFLRFDESVLIRQLMTFSDLRDLYLQALEDTARSAAADNWLGSEIDRVAALVTEAAYTDTHKQYSNQQYDEGVAYLRAVAQSRPGFVLAEIAKARNQP